MLISELTPKQCLQAYLCCSYMYYIQFESLVEDHEYDALSKKLLDNYEDWQDHQHAYLVSKEDLQAGTLFTKKDDDYPEVVKQAATIWMRGTT